MISEPELAGADDSGGGRWAEGLDGQAPDGPGPDRGPGAVRESPGRPGVRGWLWAVGGGAVASAIWAGGLWAYEAGPPDTGGYRASRDLCTDVPLRSITAILGMPEPGLPTSTTHPDRSTAACQYLFPPPGKDGSFDRPGVHLVYTLHRRTDPGPEFEAAVQARADREKPGAALETVDGLGERAYVHGADSSAATLHVLDGQATLTLSLTTSAPTRSDPTGVPTDLTAVQDSAVQDLRAALDALRS